MAADAPAPDAPPLYWCGGDDADPTVVGQSTGAVFMREDDGSVWLVPEDASTRAFVNSTTSRFHESMVLFQPLWRSLDPDSDATATVERLAIELRMIDERAFTERDSFWPSVLEQVEDGLL